MADLRREEARKLLAAIWTHPVSLDPSREQARVTRKIAERLAAVSKALEARGHGAEEVAQFLMRCLFTMFAEDVDLLPRGKFTELLRDCVENPDAFAPLLEELWAKMDEPDSTQRFYGAFRERLRHFNGNLFRAANAFPLGREEIGELLAAANYRWTEVDPAIFGTLLEQALDPKERRKLGAHYTPRAYVQRLVEVTVMEPLRGDWQRALTMAESAKDHGDERRAVQIVRAFHHKLCTTRVLDPACGTGNFLYVSLELMKKLEGEVLEALIKLGESDALGLEGEEVDPHQFLGLELNPRAAAIAELVVWIGYLQQHYRAKTGHPKEPILRAFKNINFGRREGYDAVLTWDSWPMRQVFEKDGKLVEALPNARRPEWPEAEFIVGNPPFIGKGATMRAALGDLYVDTLWSVHRQMNESADFVMYWWDRAAERLVRKGAPLRRFGLVTTNSITQLFNRRTIERHLASKSRVSIVFAIPDHPWTKATRDAASVRIAMTVGEAGSHEGVLAETLSESELDTDAPSIEFTIRAGEVNADLTIGANVAKAGALRANEGLSWNGMMLAARGFLVSPDEAQHLRMVDGGASDLFLKPYKDGTDLVRIPRKKFVIDFFGLTPEFARKEAPAAYTRILESVKPERDQARDTALREKWWLFGRTRPDLRAAVDPLARYIGTTETSKHRLFQFIDSATLPDHMIIAIAHDDAAFLALLSSRQHVAWAMRAGGWLGIGNDPRYSKSRCFDPFPFPQPSTALRENLRTAGEELDALRKRVITNHPDLTLTGLYNVLEKVKAGADLTPKDEDIKERGLVLILRELHETIDRFTADAYGWPADLSDDAMLERLVALNAERAKEEAAGYVRWLRPDYQIPRFAKGAAAETGQLDLRERVVPLSKQLLAWPSDRDEHSPAVEAALAAAGRPMDASALSRSFRHGGKKIEPRVAVALKTLARYGRISALDDGRFAPHGLSQPMRRAA